MPFKFIVAGNTLAQLVSKGVTSAATFVITIIIAREYGAVGYGDFTKIFSYVVVFYLLSDFGLNAVFLRESETEHKKLHIASLIGIRMIISILLIFGSLAIVAFLPYYPATSDGFSPLVKFGIILLSPTILTMGLQTSFNALFQKNLRYDKATVASVLGSIATLSVVVLLASIRASVSILMIGYLFGGIVTAASAYLISKPVVSWQSVSWPEQLEKGKSLLMLSVPLGLTLVFSVIHFRADVFILTLYRSTIEVGVYGLASKFFEFALTVPTFFMNAVYPVLLLSISDQEKSVRIVKKSAIALGIGSMVILLGGMVFAPFLIYIKEDFADSIMPFRILMATLPLFFISSVLMWYLIAKNRTWRLVWIYGAGMIVNIILNILFIPQYGAVAAAVTTGISEGVLIVLLAYYAYPLLSIKKL